MTNLEFDKTVDLIRICMTHLGVWPEFEETMSSKLKFYISFFFATFFVLIPQTTNLYFVRFNLADIIEILTYGDLPTCVICYKMYNGWVNKQGKRE